MGFKLKTNNRKVESGTVITAKIVSPDKSAYDYQDFSIVVQPQSLTDKEKVIRDAQTIASILDSNNPDWTRITDKIRGVYEASKAAQYCDVIFGDKTTPSGSNSLIDNGESVDHVRIININNGEVIKRPPYSSTATQAGFTATLQMTVRSGEEMEVIRRVFTVPMYTKEEVLANITDQWKEQRIWNLIKNNNSNKNSIRSNLTIPTALSALTSMGLEGIIDTSNDDNIPTLEFTFPSYYTPNLANALINNSGEVAAVSAVEAWQMDRTIYSVNGVYVRDLSTDDCSALGINGPKTKGEVVAYRFYSKSNDQNKIIGRWSYDAMSVSGSIANVGFLSQAVDIADIKNNIAQSFSLGWFMPTDALISYGITDTPIGNGNNQSNRKTITIPSGKHIVFKLPTRFSTMVTDDTNPVVDYSNTGYSYNPLEGSPVGFADSMFANMTISFNEDLHSTYNRIDVDSSLDADPSLTIGDAKDFTADQNNTKYLYLNASEAKTFTGALNLILNETSLGAGANITIYFSVNIA
jgi:hypothetical protein